MADSRLRASDPASRAADVSLGQQGVERNEKIEIDRGEIHHVNSRDSINRLDESTPASHTSRMTAIVPSDMRILPNGSTIRLE